MMNISKTPSVNYDALSREQLIAALREKTEPGITIDFSGKAKAKEIFRAVRPRAFRIAKDLCVGSEEYQSKNLIVEGENLMAMVSLYKFHGEIDLIVADPPFNTGKDFRYNDKWDVDPNDPFPGDVVSTEDGSRLTKWMRYMLPRLQLMRMLLKPNGVVAICIDHRELFRLGLLMNEVFGEDNRIGILNWQRTYSPKNNVRQHLSHSTEYVLVYAKQSDIARTRLLSRSESMNLRYKNPDNDLEGDWRASDISGPGASTHRGQVYKVQSPFTGEWHPPPDGRCWAAGRKVMKERLEAWGVKYHDQQLNDGNVPALAISGSLAAAKSSALKRLAAGQWPELVFGDDGNGEPGKKTYLRKVRQGVVPMTFWANEEYETPFELGSVSWTHEASGHSQAGINELTAIVGKGNTIEGVKPLKLISKIINLWCPPDGIVLDPFAGSGTTGHAVLFINVTTGANRKFVLIEQGRIDKHDKYARSLLSERLRRVISGDWASGPHDPLGGGYRFYTLTRKVDAKAVLAMEREELIDLVLASHWDEESNTRLATLHKIRDNARYLIATDIHSQGYFLIWTGPDDTSALTMAVHDEIMKEAKAHGILPPFNVYGRYEDFQATDIRFYKIPDQILLHIGLSETRDAYNG
jgi:adenine-specific DNA-methyltransferase